jgi:hypothetical protein
LLYDGVGSLPYFAIRHEIIRPLAVVNRVQRIWVEEGLDCYGLFGIDGTKRLKFIAINDDVLVFGNLVSWDDFIFRDFAVNGAELLVMYATITSGVNLVKTYAAASGN